MDWQPVPNEPILVEHFTAPLQILEKAASSFVTPGGPWAIQPAFSIGSQALALSTVPVAVRVPRHASQLSLNIDRSDLLVSIRSRNEPDRVLSMSGVNRRGSGLRLILVNPLLPDNLIPRDHTLIGDVFELSSNQPVNVILLWS